MRFKFFSVAIMTTIASAIRVEELFQALPGESNMSQTRNEAKVINALDHDELITNLAIQVPTVVRMTSKKEGTNIKRID